MSRADLDALLNVLLPLAEETLERHGEFYPFGAGMGKNGEISQVAGYPGGEHPESQEVLRLLVGGLKAQAQDGGLRAAGICLDVRTIPPGEVDKVDAVCTRLEHVDGEAIEVFLPYRKGLLGGIDYGDLFAREGTPQVFVAAG